MPGIVFRNSYTRGRKTVGEVLFRDLLGAGVRVPQLQRLVDPAKVEAIANHQDKVFRATGRFYFPGTLCLATLASNMTCSGGTLQLIDGQHRFMAIERLCGRYGHNAAAAYVDVEHHAVDSDGDLRALFELINTNTPLPDVLPGVDESDLNAAKGAAARLFAVYGADVFTSAKRPPRPRINRNNFQTALSALARLLRKHGGADHKVDASCLVSLVQDKSRRMQAWPAHRYNEKIRRMQKWAEHKRNADAIGFYLGMYRPCSELYVYNWVREIVDEQTGVLLPGKRKKRGIKKKKKKAAARTKIPPSVRRAVWDTHVGKTERRARCACCGIAELDVVGHWECGHVVAHARGGPATVANLRPVCRLCNAAMGTEDMRAYTLRMFAKKI